MNPLRAIHRTIDRIAAWLHLQSGQRLYRRGRFARAAARIQDAIALEGPSFRAHLLLGKIYLRLNRFDRARQEFAKARFLDPGRFSAEGLPEDLLLEMAERFYQPIWRDSSAGPDGRGSPVPATESVRRARDDFSSDTERARFSILPPIRADELDHVDWSDSSLLFEDGES